MGLDWENVVEDWDGENCQKNQAWEDCSGPKRNLGDSSNRDCMFASKDYAATMRRPRSGIPVALAEYRKQGTLQRYGSVPDSMNNPDCELVAGYLVDIGWIFCFQSLYSPHQDCNLIFCSYG